MSPVVQWIDIQRVSKSCLDDSIGDRIDPSHPILTWLVEHVASVDRRTSVGQDGRTPMHRTRGRHGRDILAEFAECVHFMPLRGNIADKKQAKINFEARFMDGVFLGLRTESSEVLIGTKMGVFKARSVKMKPE